MNHVYSLVYWKTNKKCSQIEVKKATGRRKQVKLKAASYGNMSYIGKGV